MAIKKKKIVKSQSSFLYLLNNDLFMAILSFLSHGIVEDFQLLFC